MKFHRTGQKFTKTYVVSGKGCATAGVLRTSQLPPTPNLHKNRLTGPNQPWLALCYCQSHYREVPRWEIFMEQELRFGLDLGRLALLKKNI